MKKRFITLLLALALACSLLVLPANAASNLTDTFDQLLNENQDTVKKLFNDNNMVLSGSCGKGGTASVKYEIYRLDGEQANTLAQYYSDKLNDLRSGLGEISSKFNFDAQETADLTGIDFGLDPAGDEYYAVKITGTGEMEDYTLTSRSPWSGKKEQLTDVTVDLDKQLIAAYIDTGVTNVGKRAFFGLDALRAVYLGNSVKVIDERAFETCNQLAVVDFPNSLERIERRAFYACDALTFSRMKNCTNLTYIGNRAFSCCNRLTNVSFPLSLKEIGDFAFSYDHVLGTNQFSMPEKLTKLGTGAFWWCPHLGIINEVNIPATLTSIGPWAFFANFNMRELTFSAGYQALTIGTGAFSGCRALKTVHFADRVKHINDFAFAACDSLTDVVFGTGNGTDMLHITTIGKQSFTSLNDTGIEALNRVADTMADSDGETATYLDHTLDLSYGISQATGDQWGVTPLAEAAFTYGPITKGNIEPATSDFNSFPKECVMIYPTQSNNAEAYYKWTAAITTGDLWEGYQTESAWSGHAHKYGTPEEIPATCTEPGRIITTCSICGEEKLIETLKPTGHKAAMDRMVMPTCTKPGVIYYSCTNAWCTTPHYTVELPATNHGEADGYAKLQNRVETQPTCTQDGMITGICPDCGNTVSVPVPSLGHDTTYMTRIQEATCTQEGIYQGRCIRCDEVARVITPTLPHDTANMSMIQEATCTQEGIYQGICSSCNESARVIVSALDHSWGEWINGTPTESQRSRCCAVCGTMEIKLTILITSHPQSYTGKLNSTASFSVSAEGDGLTYQWQISDDGGKTWSNSSVKNPKYSTKLTSGKDGRMVRCIVTDQYGNSVTSDAAVMKVAKLVITASPQDYMGKLNSTAKFTVSANGEGLTYQWQTSSDGGKTWANSSVKNASYSTKLTASKDGRMVRCVVSDQYGNTVTSGTAAMKIYRFAITSQPQNYVGKVNSSAKFTVIAVGDGLSYQWQYSSNGTKWVNSSVKSAVYTTKLTDARDGRYVRCIVTDCYGGKLTTDPVTMKIG